ncbi:MAG: septum formation initiator family protein [Paludibacteraceae bacterium]|nr:septum formation initiator family protein [Paludibacteraceae bacterium]
MKPDWKKIWSFSRKYVLNKYILTCVVFAVILTFCGEQSLVVRTRQARQIRALQHELEESRKQIEQYKKDLKELQSSTENIERFARENYYMHADNEDVYIVE